MSSGSKRERLEASAEKPALDDSTNWLVTFSDLVLQLFAFVVVAAVLTRSGSEGTPSPRQILRQAADSLVGIAAPIPGVPVARAGHWRPRAVVRSASTTGAAGRTRPDRPAPTEAPLRRSDDENAISAAVRARSDGATHVDVAIGPRGNGRAAVAAAPVHAAGAGFPGAKLYVTTAAAAPTGAPSIATSSTVLVGAGETRDRAAPDAPSREAQRPVPGTAPRESELRPEPKAERAPRALSPDQSWRSISRYLEALLEAEHGRATVGVEASASGVLLRVGEAAGFATGTAELRGAKHSFVGAVAALAADLPEVVIEITGHTDDRPLHGGRFDSNLDLSFARARHVADRLLHAAPALAGRILVAGWGADRPLVPNESAAARALNRRVEIRLRAAS